MKTIRKLLAFLLCAALVVATVPAAFASEIKNEGELTRAEWVAMLIDAVDPEVPEGDEWPQVFSDVEPGSPAYRQIQTAALFNVFASELESGLFNPNEPASREFVAVTAVRLLGYISAETGQVINDLHEAAYPDMVEIAVSIGYLDVDGNGNSRPHEAADKKLAETVAALAREEHADFVNHVFSDNYDNEIIMRNDLHDLTHLAFDNFTFLDAENFSLIETNTPASQFAAGSVVIFPGGDMNPYGIALKIVSARSENGVTRIETELPELWEVFDVLDIEVVGDFYVEEDDDGRVNLTPVSGNHTGAINLYLAAGNDAHTFAQLASQPANIFGEEDGYEVYGGNGNSFEAEFSVDTFKAKLNLEISEIKMKISADYRFLRARAPTTIIFQMDYTAKLEVGGEGKIDGKEWDLGEVRLLPMFAGPVYMSITAQLKAEFSVTGYIGGGITYEGRYGFARNPNGSERIPQTYTERKLHGEINAEAKISLIPVLRFNIYSIRTIETGFEISLSAKISCTRLLNFEDAGICFDVEAGFSVNVFIQMGIGKGKRFQFKLTAELFSIPFVDAHFEGTNLFDAKIVPFCTRDIRLEAERLELLAGTHDRLQIFFTDHEGNKTPVSLDAENQISLESADSNIAVVDNTGRVEGVRQGETQIKITMPYVQEILNADMVVLSSKTLQAEGVGEVSVQPFILSVEPADVEMRVGETQAFRLYFQDVSGKHLIPDTEPVEYRVNGDAALECVEELTFRADSAGDADIIFRVLGEEVTATIKVTEDKPFLKFDPPSQSVKVNERYAPRLFIVDGRGNERSVSITSNEISVTANGLTTDGNMVYMATEGTGTLTARLADDPDVEPVIFTLTARDDAPPPSPPPPPPPPQPVQPPPNTDGWLLIYTADDLARVASENRSGQLWTREANYLLMNDITAHSDTVIPRINGIFNGGGHTITYSRQVDYDIRGLIDFVGRTGVLMNLTVKAELTLNETARSDNVRELGGIVNRNMGLIENCHFTGNISAGYGAIGGIAGQVENVDEAVIRNCTSSGSITGSRSQNVGGIVGINRGLIEGCENKAAVTGPYAGGIAGHNIQGDIDNCKNSGDVRGINAEGIAYAGGIASRNSYSSGTMIANCENTGKVSGNYAGGIAAANAASGSMYLGVIINCKNFGEVTSDDGSPANRTGGIAAHNQGLIENCENTGNITGTDNVGGIAGWIDLNTIIRNCRSSASITGLTSEGTYAGDRTSISGGRNIGGIAGGGVSRNIIIENCTSSGSVTGYNNVGGITGIYFEDPSAYVVNCSSTARFSASMRTCPYAGMWTATWPKLYEGQVTPVRYTRPARQNDLESWRLDP